MRKVLTGPQGVRIVLDSAEIFPDDPGQRDAGHGLRRSG
jgi:hypothetical protein